LLELAVWAKFLKRLNMIDDIFYLISIHPILGLSVRSWSGDKFHGNSLPAALAGRRPAAAKTPVNKDPPVAETSRAVFHCIHFPNSLQSHGNSPHPQQNLETGDDNFPKSHGMDDTSDKPSQPRPKRRAPRACQFCRLRKVRAAPDIRCPTPL
jgi:hypothetical protein